MDLLGVLYAIIASIWAYTAGIVSIFLPISHKRSIELDAANAKTYEEWHLLQGRLDALRNGNLLAAHDHSNAYDATALRSVKDELESARRSGDNKAVAAKLRSIYSRNPANILNPVLYHGSNIRTEPLIHEYNLEVQRCIEHLCKMGDKGELGKRLSHDTRRQLFSDVRGSIGTTTLVLMGGALLSMCHVGVARALHMKGLLPRIITGTGTGALIAAIIGVTPEARLLDRLSSDAINLNAFAHAKLRRQRSERKAMRLATWWRALQRRVRRFIYTGHFFDIDVLIECARDNVEDLTFEEAFAVSGRTLNITIAVPEVAGTPQLLNRYTAPHVLIWSAVAASIATSRRMYAPAHLYCKNDIGVIDRYIAADAVIGHGQTQQVLQKETPLQRIGELFDTNHYIVSQTRPYVAPFMRLQAWADRSPLLGAMTRVVFCEVVHWLEFLNTSGLAPTWVSRILIDEEVPSSASWSKLIITPKLGLEDYLKMVDEPTVAKITDLVLKGERGTWPLLCQIEVRERIELALEAAAQREAIRSNGNSFHAT